MLARAADLPGVALLDSGGPAWGETSILGVGGEVVARWPDDGADPFEVVRARLSEFEAPRHPEWPFTGGLIGWFGYEVRSLIEQLPDRHPRDTVVPDAYWCAYRVCALRDEATGRCEIVWLEDPGDPSATRRARELVAALRRRLLDADRAPGPPRAPSRRARRCP